MALATPIGIEITITMSIMNNEPMNAPAKPLIAGELRESGLTNKLVLNVLSMIPFASN